jgi:hypothetical protein
MRIDEFDEPEEEGEGPYRLRQRFTSARIERDGAVVGAVKIIEYDIPPIWTSWFWEGMDGYSHSASEVAQALLSAWPDFPFDVACYGNVLELNRLWVEPTAAGTWIPVVDQLLRRVQRRTAIVIAKAYPLEYEGKLPDGAPERPAFEQRRRAMLRLYGNRLDLHPLPGRSGEQGWIWKPRPGLERLIDEPVFDESWHDDL